MTGLIQLSKMVVDSTANPWDPFAQAKGEYSEDIQQRNSLETTIILLRRLMFN